MEEKYITIDISLIVKWLEEAIAKEDWSLVKILLSFYKIEQINLPKTIS